MPPMKWIISLFLFWTIFIQAHEFFDRFDQLKVENWEELCRVGEKALEEDLLPEEAAQIHARLASSYFYLGDYEAMKKHTLACQSLALDHDSQPYLIRSLYLLSAYYRGQKQFLVAQSTIQEALKLLTEEIDPCLKAKVFFNAGAAWADDPNGNPHQALAYYKNALALFESHSDDAYRTQIRLAKVYLLLGQNKQAWKIIFPLLEQTLEPKTTVHLLYVSAQLHLLEGNQVEALRLIEQALPLAEQLQMKVDVERLKTLSCSSQNSGD